MPEFECSGVVISRRTIEQTYSANDRVAAFKAFREEHGVEPESVGGIDVVGCCEACGMPIFTGSGYMMTLDEATLCMECVLKGEEL